MSILDKFEAQAIENVANGSEFRDVVVSQLGYGGNTVSPNITGDKSVEADLVYEVSSNDDEVISRLIMEDPETNSLEKAIRSGNDDLAYELAENIFDNSIDEFKIEMSDVVDKKVEYLKQRFNELVNEQEVYMMGYVSTSITLFELFDERDYDEVDVDIYIGWDMSYFHDKSRYVIDLVTDSLEKRGLMDEPLDEE